MSLYTRGAFIRVGTMAGKDEPQRPAFGNRFLDDPSRVFEHNAWDNVEWGSEQERSAEEKVRENSSEVLPPGDVAGYESGAAGYWDSFYQQHQNRFFKDRHWLFTEFPELKLPAPASRLASGQKFTILEVGCGAGNTVFPILQTNRCPGLFVYCCDFAESAVKIVQEHPLYEPSRCHAFQCDITSQSSPLPFPPATIDVIILVFVLSAVQPEQMQSVVCRLSNCLRPGGLILFRDYGRYDMAQLRFKKGQCLSENFYVRGDGTRVYFFTEAEVSTMFTGAGLSQEQLYVDRRLQVNRGRQLKMYRVWIQGKFRKHSEDSHRHSPDSSVSTTCTK